MQFQVHYAAGYKRLFHNEVLKGHGFGRAAKDQENRGLRSPPFGQPLNINTTNLYRKCQIQLGLRMRFWSPSSRAMPATNDVCTSLAL